VRIKLDENLPRSAAKVLAERGHDVDTVTDEDLSGARDADIVAAAARTARLLLTLDRRLADIRRYPPGTHARIVVLRPTNQSAAAVRAVVTGLAASSRLESLAGLVAVAQPGLLRIRRT
jgi:predicted nuclease of predicted toxin-antitoxin system